MAQGGASRGHPNKIIGAQKRKQALQLRLQGMSYQAIADEMKLTSKRYAWRMVMQELRNIPKEEANELRQLELDRLDALTNAIWPSAMTGDPKAVETAIKVIDRRVRMLGLDSPHKISFGAEEGISMIGSLMLAIKGADLEGVPEIEDGSDDDGELEDSESDDDSGEVSDEPGDSE